MATVPVFTHCPYFAVCNLANFAANAAACFPGNGCPPHNVLSNTSFSPFASALVGIGHRVNGVFLSGLPPVIASFPTRQYLHSESKLNYVALAFMPALLVFSSQ